MAKGAATREGDFGTHGEPLPADEIAATKKGMCLIEGQCFQVPAEAKAHFQARYPALREASQAWTDKLAKKLKRGSAEFKTFWKAMNTGRAELVLPMPTFEPGKKVATRAAWGNCLNVLKDALPTLMGGSADLDPSNQTSKFRDSVGIFAADNYTGRNLSFGVREFPMAVIMNGMALHGGVIPFGATFLTFSDYCRNAIRMSSLQKLPVLYVFTHDSFYVGEDGPTHQPIEHVASLRLIPGLIDLRPADATETALCLEVALRQTAKPSCIFLTRQNLPTMDPAEYPAIAEGVKKGGYILRDCAGSPDIIVMATGSEVSLALDAVKLLEAEAPGRKFRVVSMPSLALFEAQSPEYKDSVLPPTVEKRVSIEAGRPEGWHKYVGLFGLALGLDHFGESAPAEKLAEKYGFTAPTVARKIRERYFG
jgi:transketolase